MLTHEVHVLLFLAHAASQEVKAEKVVASGRARAAAADRRAMGAGRRAAGDRGRQGNCQKHSQFDPPVSRCYFPS